MHLNRASSYALTAMAYIANNNGRCSGHSIAEACNLPPGHLLKVLQQLVKARLLTSERGPAGGFEMRKPANETTMLEVIEATEGEIQSEIRGINDIKIAAKSKNVLKRVCDEITKSRKDLLSKIHISALC